MVYGRLHRTAPGIQVCVFILLLSWMTVFFCATEVLGEQTRTKYIQHRREYGGRLARRDERVAKVLRAREARMSGGVMRERLMQQLIDDTTPPPPKNRILLQRDHYWDLR